MTSAGRIGGWYPALMILCDYVIIAMRQSFTWFSVFVVCERVRDVLRRNQHPVTSLVIERGQRLGNRTPLSGP